MARSPTAPYLRPIEGGANGSAPASRPANEATVAELIVRAVEGDAKAWARLYQMHFDGLHRDALYLAGSTTVADEIVQDTFAAALVGLKRFDGRSSFQTWLGGIARNLVHKHWRKQQRRRRAHDDLEQHRNSSAPGESSDISPESQYLQRRRAAVLRSVLEKLPSNVREVFVMRDVQGLAVDEVARRLNITPTNVRVRATRARARIREELARLGWLPKRGRNG